MQIPSVGAAGYSPPSTASAGGRAAAAVDPVADFMAMVSKTPAQQMRDAILRQLGVSEDDLKSMSTEARAKIEEKIKELTRQQVQESTEKKTGLVIDMRA